MFLKSFDSYYSSRIGWMRWQMTFPCFSSLAIIILAGSQCCLSSVLWVSIWLSVLLLLLRLACGQLPFLTTLLRFMPVLENGTDAATNASAEILSYHILLQWQFMSADFLPSLLSSKMIWETYDKSPVTFCVVPKHCVFSHNNYSELKPSLCHLLIYSVLLKFKWRGCSGYGRSLS